MEFFIFCNLLAARYEKIRNICHVKLACRAITSLLLALKLIIVYFHYHRRNHNGNRIFFPLQHIWMLYFQLHLWTYFLTNLKSHLMLNFILFIFWRLHFVIRLIFVISEILLLFLSFSTCSASTLFGNL